MFYNIVKKLTEIKKIFLPTTYDLEQKAVYNNCLSFYGKFINPNDLCFDIGANYGNRTIVFLALGA